MELTRFEQISLAAVLKIVKEQERLSKIKIAKVLLERSGGTK
jgi:hypothetical protein